MKGIEAIRAFEVVLEKAFTGRKQMGIEMGETWTAEGGWKAYIRVGMSALILAPAGFRKLGEKYQNHPHAPDEIREMGSNMIVVANAAEMRNKAREIPGMAAAFLPHRGSA